MKVASVLSVLAVSVCAGQREGVQLRAQANAPVYKAPAESRCAKFKVGGVPASQCANAKYLGELYVRRLSTGDEVCLEGAFGEAVKPSCPARATVIDSAPNRVLLEVRGPKPGSKWFAHEQHHFWFEEGALVDLYIADHGY